jgi:nitrogen fixation protein FixH
MKLNWGHKIIITFGFFFLLMGTLIYKSINTDFQLVAPNYYEQEIAYQQRIDAIKRAENLDFDLSLDIDGNLDLISSEVIQKGIVYFYCPFDKSSDFQVELGLINNKQSINLGGVKKGKWEVEIRFKRANLLYIIKQIIVL